ncbi:carbohydrate ABC transporter permease [Spongisporangium articulatum]|uniref:Carbohydrate ABC transporter permease n=1 Tax=Spongisporangium articulatum TaxID=3362603 RepID=A0ABW8AJK2_9ACTN
MLIKLINTILTVIAGVGVALIVFWILNKLAELLPGKWEDRVKPYLYVLPALLAIAVYVVYPAIQTVVYSFANSQSTAFVGFDNYTHLFKQENFRNTLVVTLVWLIVAPILAVGFGLLAATLFDRLKSGSEKTAKTVVFFPMAISAVGAGVVWRFVYAFAPEGAPQIGLQNAIVTLFGHEPIAWLEQSAAFFNTFLLIIMFLWLQVGFSMVLLSAAIKGVPVDTLEAARVDGATELQIFRRVVVPQIMPTVVTVYVTVTIGVLKLFDVVYVMSNGSFNTNVLATEFYNQISTNFDNGAASAIVVIMIIAVIPVMVFQVRQFRIQEANR